jgi:hypothetical protein
MLGSTPSTVCKPLGSFPNTKKKCTCIESYRSHVLFLMSSVQQIYLGNSSFYLKSFLLMKSFSLNQSRPRWLSTTFSTPLSAPCYSSFIARHGSTCLCSQHSGAKAGRSRVWGQPGYISSEPGLYIVRSCLKKRREGGKRRVLGVDLPPGRWYKEWALELVLVAHAIILATWKNGLWSQPSGGINPALHSLLFSKMKIIR